MLTLSVAARQTSTCALVTAPRFGARVVKATTEPSALMVGCPESSVPGAPLASWLTRRVVPATMSRTKICRPGAPSPASMPSLSEANTTKRPSALVTRRASGWLSPSSKSAGVSEDRLTSCAKAPLSGPLGRETRRVVPAARVLRKTWPASPPEPGATARAGPSKSTPAPSPEIAASRPPSPVGPPPGPSARLAQVVTFVVRSRTWMSAVVSVSPSPRFAEVVRKATRLPSELIEAFRLSPVPRWVRLPLTRLAVTVSLAASRRM